MKKLLLVLVVLFALSCSSSDDNSQDIASLTTLTEFTEPYFVYDAPKSEIISRYGSDYDTGPNSFSLGYDMEYESNQNGVYKNSFSLNNQEELYETSTLFYSGIENIDFIKSYLNSKYTFISENSNLGLYNGYWEKNDLAVSLIYLDGSYEGTIVSYRKNN